MNWLTSKRLILQSLASCRVDGRGELPDSTKFVPPFPVVSRLLEPIGKLLSETLFPLFSIDYFGMPTRMS